MLEQEALNSFFFKASLKLDIRDIYHDFRKHDY